MLPVIAMAALLGEPGFFERRPVDFWDTKRSVAPPAAADLWADSVAPPPVKRLLETPTAENARAYLAWQEERMRRLRAAISAVESARESAAILYFAREGCGWCARQEEELRGLTVVRVPAGSPLWEKYGVTVTPTLVAAGKTLRGFTTREAIARELRRD